MSINKTRGILYKLAKLLGDLSALSSGKPGKARESQARQDMQTYYILLILGKIPKPFKERYK